MNNKLLSHFENELSTAKSYISKKDYKNGFYHLEKAHILGQRYVISHTKTHWYMLKIGWLKKDYKEVIGQLIRLPLGIIGSFIGVIPVGNTGGSNVSAFKKMKIPQELLELMKGE